MKNNSLHRNIVKAGVSVLLCLLLIVSALPTVGTARDIIGKAAPSLGSVLPIAKTGDAVNKKPIPVPSFCFTVQIPKIDISDAVGDDGHTYQKITMPDSPVTTKPIGGPQIPYLVKNVHIPDNAKDITIQVQTNGAPTVYQDILVYPCPQKIVKTDDKGNKYLAEKFCFDEKKYTGQHSVPEKQVEIVEDGYLRSVRIVSLNVYPVSYVPSSRTIEVANSMTITVQWSVDQTIKIKRDTTKGFEKLIAQVAMNYEENNDVSQKTQSATRGSAVFITGSQLRDTTTMCDYLVITHPDFFPSAVLADFVNYRATYSNLNVVVVQTSDIYAQFPDALGQDYSIKDFMQYAYDHWQTAPQYLLIVGNKQYIPSHQTSCSYPGDGPYWMDDEKWYVRVDGGDIWPDIAMGRFPVNNQMELGNITEKIIYYEQQQLRDKPFSKKAFVIQAACQDATQEYNRLFNAGFNTTYFNTKDPYGFTNLDIINQINAGQDIIYYSGHGGLWEWCYNLNINDLSSLTNTVYPIVMTTACWTADLDYESFGKCFLTKDHSGAVAYYGATIAAVESSTNQILAEIFDNGEYRLGMAIMQGEFNDGDLWHSCETYILLGDPALQSLGYPADTNLPDLFVSSYDVDYQYQTQQLTIGVSNIGAVDAYNVLVNVDIVDEGSGEHVLLGSHVFDVVPTGGEVQSVTLTGVVPLVKGEYPVFAVADPENLIEESFELNNDAGKRMMVSPTFIDVTSQSGLGNIPIARRVVTHADINNDGYDDIFITGFRSYLFVNDGDGTFTDATWDTIGMGWISSSCAVFADFDNDGYSDLYVCNVDRLFHNPGDGRLFEDVTDSAGLGGYSSDEAVVGDVNNDGYLDLLIITHTPPHVVLFINDGDGTFTDESSVCGLDGLNSGEYVTCPRFVDIDNDSDLDLLIDHRIDSSSPFEYYRNDGSGRFIPVTLFPWGCLLPNSMYSPFYPKFSTSDINSDGNIDLLIIDNRCIETFILQDNGGNITYKTDPRYSLIGLWSGSPLFAEVDNNPGEDLLVEWYLLRNSKQGVFKNFEHYIQWYHINDTVSAPCVFDMDHDGDNDFILGNYCYSKPILVFENQVNNQNWLDVKPVGVISNHDAIGAKVYVFSSQGELVGFQEVSSQRSVPIHFGVDSSKTYVVRIYWPASDKWDVVEDVAPAQLITCVEGSTYYTNAYGPYSGSVGEEIHFTGSIFGGIGPYTWSWDFGDGNITSYESIDNITSVVHVYTAENVYGITLTVIDLFGKTASTTTMAFIPKPLIANVNIGGPYTGLVGVPISITGSVTGGKEPYTWHWDFGDGNTTSYESIDNTTSVTHTYTAEGEYGITLTVTDLLDNIASNTTMVSINEPEPLNVNIEGPSSGYCYVPITFTGVVTGGVPPYAYTWNFGDISTVPGDYPTITHSYMRAGTFTIVLTVNDSFGVIAESNHLTCVISQLPPEPPTVTHYNAYNDHPNDMNKGIGRIRWNTPGGVLQTFTATSTQIIPGNIYYKFSFGDGTNSGWLGPYTSGQVATTTHDFNNIGYFNVTAVARVSMQTSNPSVPLTVRMYKLGDVNGDGMVTFADIDPFVIALNLGKDTYYASYPSGYWYTADTNLNNDVTYADIDPFVALLST